MVKEETQAKSRNRAELSKGRGGGPQNMAGGSSQRGGGRGGNRGNYHKGGGNPGSSGNGPQRSNASSNPRLLMQSNEKRK